MLGCFETLYSCRYVKQGTVLTNYADVLAILVRLRQLCCHPGLLGSYAGAGENNMATVVLSFKFWTSQDLC